MRHCLKDIFLNRTTICSIKSTTGYLSKEIRSVCLKVNGILMVTESLDIMTKSQEHLKHLLIDGWIKEHEVYIHNKILLCLRKKSCPQRTMWVNLEGFVLAEISQGHTVIAGSCLYLKVRKAKLIEAGSRVVVIGILGWGD